MIGFDGSEPSWDALELGALLSAALDARPVLVTVTPEPAELMRGLVPRERIDERAEELLESARRSTAIANLEIRQIGSPSAARGLAEAAEAISPIAMVVGSAHRGALGRVLVGSVGHALLSGVPCAIAVAPRGYGKPDAGGLTHLGVGVASSVESRAALRSAVALAMHLGARLRVVSACEPRASGSYAMAETATESEREELEHSVGSMVERTLEPMDGDVEVEQRVVVGEAGATLVAESEDLDLLFVGSRGHGPLQRAVLGSVAGRLMTEAPCPVLVLPRRAGSDPLDLDRMESMWRRGQVAGAD